MLIKDFLEYAAQKLEPLSETAQLEAQVILAHVLEKERVWVLAHPEGKLKAAELQAAENALSELLGGVPLAYITGEREFFGLPFWVNESVLIPRPETELLVEYALQWLKSRPQAVTVLDVGTGSGCITVSLAYYQPRIRAIGIDLSWSALQVARKNSQRHQVTAATAFIQSDLCLPLVNPYGLGSFDLICANLPYVPSKEARRLIAEPQLALNGGKQGLAVMRRFLPQAAQLIKPQGLLLLEIGLHQRCAIERLASLLFPNVSVAFIEDLAGIKRICAIQT